MFTVDVKQQYNNNTSRKYCAETAGCRACSFSSFLCSCIFVALLSFSYCLFFRSFNVWIGLHSLEIGSSYTWVYGKPTCLQVDNSWHSHWSSGEPKNQDTSRCAVQDMNSGEWSVRKCQWTIYKFICEKQESKLVIHLSNYTYKIIFSV